MQVPRPDRKPRGEVSAAATGGGTRKRRWSFGRWMRKLISGGILVGARMRRHYPFLLFCCLLVLVYMGYKFDCHSVQRDELRLRIECDRLRARSLIFSSERIERTRHRNITTEVESRGLKIREWPTPPSVIRDENDDIVE